MMRVVAGVVAASLPGTPGFEGVEEALQDSVFLLVDVLVDVAFDLVLGFKGGVECFVWFEFLVGFEGGSCGRRGFRMGWLILFEGFYLICCW